MRRVLKLVCERTDDVTRFCEDEIHLRGSALQEASELARVALMQHTLEHSLSALPPAPRARAQRSQGHPENGGSAPQTLGGSGARWNLVALAAARALKAPNACADHALLLRVAAALEAEAQGARRMTFVIRKREDLVARAAVSDSNSRMTIANLRASLDTWESVTNQSLPAHPVLSPRRVLGLIPVCVACRLPATFVEGELNSLLVFLAAVEEGGGGRGKAGSAHSDGCGGAGG